MRIYLQQNRTQCGRVGGKLFFLSTNPCSFNYPPNSETWHVTWLKIWDKNKSKSKLTWAGELNKKYKNKIRQNSPPSTKVHGCLRHHNKIEQLSCCTHVHTRTLQRDENSPNLCRRRKSSRFTITFCHFFFFSCSITHQIKYSIVS